jgi:hypothetical protein
MAMGRKAGICWVGGIVVKFRRKFRAAYLACFEVSDVPSLGQAVTRCTVFTFVGLHVQLEGVGEKGKERKGKEREGKQSRAEQSITEQNSRRRKY